jgi:hypothetical protein
VGLKSNGSFRDFPYYGKITKSKYSPTEKSKYCPTEKKEKKQALASAKHWRVLAGQRFSVGQYFENKI